MSIQDTEREGRRADDWIRILRGPFGRTREEIEEIAREEGLWPMTIAHWRVLQFVRASTRSEGAVPALVRVARATGYRLNRLQELFPNGVIRTALRLSGHDLPLDLQPGCPCAGDEVQ